MSSRRPETDRSSRAEPQHSRPGANRSGANSQHNTPRQTVGVSQFELPPVTGTARASTYGVEEEKRKTRTRHRELGAGPRHLTDDEAKELQGEWGGELTPVRAEADPSPLLRNDAPSSRGPSLIEYIDAPHGMSASRPSDSGLDSGSGKLPEKLGTFVSVSAFDLPSPTTTRSMSALEGQQRLQEVGQHMAESRLSLRSLRSRQASPPRSRGADRKEPARLQVWRHASPMRHSTPPLWPQPQTPPPCHR